MTYKIELAPKFRLPEDPDFWQKMNESWNMAKEEESRWICCPVCKQKLMEVFSRNHEVIRVKCANCKLNVPIDIGIFRTIRKRHRETFEEFMARHSEPGG